MNFPKPRYEVQRLPGGSWQIWDMDRDLAVLGTVTRIMPYAEKTAATLNREYQRWLTDRFYDRQTA